MGTDREPSLYERTNVPGSSEHPLMGVLAIFSTGTYAGIGMVCRV